MKLTQRVLRNVARLCDFKWSYQNEKLAQEMLQFMKLNQGIGLSATQIGIAKRVFVMEINGRRRICFNPEIVESSKNLEDFDERCLSFPGQSFTIKRPSSVQVKYQTAWGEWIHETLGDLEARCFQHEFDHLNGITMWDRHKEQNAKQS